MKSLNDIIFELFIILLYLSQILGFLKICFEFTTGKGIGCIYKHSQHNWQYPPHKTAFGIPQLHTPSTKKKALVRVIPLCAKIL